MSNTQFLSRMTLSGSLFHGLALALITIASTIPLPAAAAVYKCIDASGNTTYTALPCPVDESTQLISRSAAALPGLDCRIARKLAIDTLSRMRDGEPSQSLYDSHGGVNSLSPLVAGLINYVYTFQGNEDASFNRIVKLTTGRCEVGSFGSDAKSCDLYPFEFLESLGGCAAALAGSSQLAQQAASQDSGKRNDYYYKPAEDAPSFTAQNSADYLKSPALGEARQSDSHARTSTGNTSSSSASSKASDDASTIECRERLQAGVDETVNQMRQAQDPYSQDRLRSRKRQLRNQLARC